MVRAQGRLQSSLYLDIHTLAQSTLRSNVETILQADAFQQGLRTQKIEFSSRAPDADTEVNPVESELIRRYTLYPVIVQHYGVSADFADRAARESLRERVVDFLRAMPP